MIKEEVGYKLSDIRVVEVLQVVLAALLLLEIILLGAIFSDIHSTCPLIHRDYVI